MKIIHVIGSYDPAKGGPQAAVVVRLAAAQASLGHRVTIVSYSDDAVSRRAAEATAMIPDFDKVQTLLLPMPDIYETFTGGRTANAVTALIRGADFVHLHGIWETNLLRASMLCRRFHIPYCVCCCDARYLEYAAKSWKKRLALKLGFRRMLDGAAFIHALNRDEIELMRPLGLKAPSLVIPNGVFLNEVEVGDMDVRACRHGALSCFCHGFITRRGSIFWPMPIAGLHRTFAMSIWWLPDRMAEQKTRFAGKLPNMDCSTACICPVGFTGWPRSQP